ncbi:MAG: hypothetical protein BGN86_10770 [Caulobacterales bacterium 68-7]|nr:hypothetical protein [Caulobacterales bacterium]OJU07920.1 MAG: hypothetical protein BGN86_10770 [Caulobacterales bacterium 68-7]
MRIASTLLLLGLTACAGVNAAAHDQSYGLPSGIASYDALAREGATCKARGGTVKASGQGDQTMLSNYFCSIPAGASK